MEQYSNSKEEEQERQGEEKEKQEGEETPAKPGSYRDLIDRLRLSLNNQTSMEMTNHLLHCIRRLEEQVEGHKQVLRAAQREKKLLEEEIEKYLSKNVSLIFQLGEQRRKSATLEMQLNQVLDTQVQELEKDNKELKRLLEENNEKVETLKLSKEQVMKNLEEKTEEWMRLKKELEQVLKEKAKIWDGVFFGKSRFWRSCPELRRSRSAEGDRRLTSVSAFHSGDPDYEESDFDIFSKSADQSRYLNLNYAIKSSTNVFSTPNKLVHQKTQTVQQKYLEKVSSDKEPGFHTQLTAVKDGLINVTQKLKVLKSQLDHMDNFSEETAKPTSCQRSLKRKAKPPEEDESGTEESKSECKSLKDILEDAKSLNAKLQNLREEKQRIIETSKKENAEVQVETKKKEKFSQTSADDSLKHCQKAVAKVEKALEEREDKAENKDEALANLVSSLSLCLFGELRRDGKKAGSTKEHYVEEAAKKIEEENGGGDNLLKNQSGSKELKIQVARLKHEIEHCLRLRK